MAQVQRHRRAIAAAFLGLAALAVAPALAQDQGSNVGTDGPVFHVQPGSHIGKLRPQDDESNVGPNNLLPQIHPGLHTGEAAVHDATERTDLYDRPVLAIDPGRHTAAIRAQAIDAAGQFVVTGGDDHTVRVWSAVTGELLQTIWIPVGPESIGVISAVAVSPDGTIVAAGGFTERLRGDHPIYLFDRELGILVHQINGDLPEVTRSLAFSPKGDFLVATLGAGQGLRVFNRNRDWSEVFRDDKYHTDSFGAAFGHDGRLAVSSYDGLVRLYRYDQNGANPNFRLEQFKPLSHPHSRGISFSPDGKWLAIGYNDVAAIDILDVTTLKRIGEQRPIDATPRPIGFDKVVWSDDGRTLFAGGAIFDNQGRALLFAWDRGGLGGERRLTYCASNTVLGLDVLPGERILAASTEPCLTAMDASGAPIWSLASPILDFRYQSDVIRVSPDGQVVDFGYVGSGGPILRFDVGLLKLSSSSPSDGLTIASNHEGLTPDQLFPLKEGDILRSLAVAPDARRIYLGSMFALTAFDETGAQKWRLAGRSEVSAVNASRGGRIVVAAYRDGAIRWHRADDGRELLALQVLPNKESDPAKWDWVLWTPEGFYEATPGAEKVLKWVVNHGPAKAATTLPVSAIPKLHRPNALPHVLDQLETAHALGVEDITQARLEVQARTGSAKPPGGVLHVLAIGVDTFGDKAGGVQLHYAAEDARDVASALLESQKGGPGRASLYADVSLTYLPNDKANGAAIIDALDTMAQSMANNDRGQDVAVILVSSHGEMIDGQFYLIPYGFDAGSKGRSIKSAVSASEFAKRVGALATHGRVLLLLDACYSGALGAQAWATDPDVKALQDAVDLENVTVLTSSKRNEKSEELPEWKHGALALAFLHGLVGAADAEGIVKLSTLTDAMENEIRSLTKDKQHLGMHVNFSGDLFMAGHY